MSDEKADRDLSVLFEEIDRLRAALEVKTKESSMWERMARRVGEAVQLVATTRIQLKFIDAGFVGTVHSVFQEVECPECQKPLQVIAGIGIEANGSVRAEFEAKAPEAVDV